MKYLFILLLISCNSSPVKEPQRHPIIDSAIARGWPAERIYPKDLSVSSVEMLVRAVHYRDLIDSLHIKYIEFERESDRNLGNSYVHKYNVLVDSIKALK